MTENERPRAGDRVAETLLAIYREEPCRTLSTAFWKVGSRIDEFQGAVETDDEGVTELRLWNDAELQVYWTRDREQFSVSRRFVAESELAVVHDDYVRSLPDGMLATGEPFFRMDDRGSSGRAPSLPSGYRFETVDVDRECGEVSRVISRCYDDLDPDPETVASWTDHPVFDEELWVWLVADATDDYVGVGVAELDDRIPEASLEWIQVLPAYHGDGLGKGLVLELRRRIGDRVAFTTVSGRYDGEDGLRRFYEACGFGGDDVWWVFRE